MPGRSGSAAALAQAIDESCGDDDAAGDDLLDIGGQPCGGGKYGRNIPLQEYRDVDLGTAAGNDIKNQCPDEGAEDGTFAAGERRAANDNGRDDFQFEGVGGGGAALVNARVEEDAGDSGEEAAE